MKTKQIQVYEFKELKPKVREIVIEKFRENNDYPFLHDLLTDRLQELLKKNKIKGEFKLLYSLSYCKGDGLCFTGRFDFKDFSFTINHNNNMYYHKHSTDIFVNEDFYEEDELKEIVQEKIRQEREEEFKGIYYKICDTLEKEGYDYIEEENSEKNIKELIKINEYTFRENGEIENL